LRSPTLKPFAENPGNLRFTALLGKEEYGIRKPTGAAVATKNAKLSGDEDRRAGVIFSCVFPAFRINFRNAKAATFSSIETSYPAQRGVGRASEAAAKSRTAAS
jgi:hypothetical protein